MVLALCVALFLENYVAPIGIPGPFHKVEIGVPALGRRGFANLGAWEIDRDTLVVSGGLRAGDMGED